MKALFIVYNQAYGDEVIAIAESLGQRGFTRFDGVGGRGSIPHLDNHAWPEYNDALMLLVEDEIAPRILAALREKDASTPELGIKAFSWKIEDIL